MMNYPPRGLWANLVTPLDDTGRPDGVALARLMARLAGDVSGFLVGSLRIGEGLHLSNEERLGLLSAAISALAPGKALFFEVTSRSEEETLALLKEAEDLIRTNGNRSEIFYFLTPLVFHGNRNLPAMLKRFCALSRRRLILRNDPELVGTLRSRLRHRNIRTSVLKKLSTNEQIVGLAYEGGLDRALNYQRALKHRSGFRFYDAGEETFLDRPSSSGLISNGVCILPSAWADVVGSSLNRYDTQRLNPDHLSRVWQSGRAVRVLMKALQPNPTGLIKRALKILGVIDHDHLTDGAVEMALAEVEALEGVLRELELLR